MSRSRLLALVALLILFSLGCFGAIALGAGETTGTNTATAIATACKANNCNTATATHTVTYTIPTVTVTTGTGAGPPADTTPFIDDIGLDGNGGSILANTTNLDKFAVLTIGGDYTRTGLPGRNIRYANANNVNDGDPDLGVSLTSARANRWVVYTDPNHTNEATYVGSPTQVFVNMGDSGYQAAWNASIDAFFANHPGVAGLFVDNWWDSLLSGGPNYPIYNYAGAALWTSDSQWQASMDSFAQNCLAHVLSLGKLVVVNGRARGDDQGTLTPAWMDQWSSDVSGITVEYWLSDGAASRPGKVFNPGAGSQYWDYWNQWRSFHQYVNSKGIGFFPMDWQNTSLGTSTIERYQRYWRATYLMDWNGGGPNHLGSWIQKPIDHSSNLWTPAMAYDPGQPLGPAVQINGIDGCWKRDFERYTVYVNANWNDQTLEGHFIASGDALFVPK